MRAPMAVNQPGLTGRTLVMSVNPLTVTGANNPPKMAPSDSPAASTPGTSRTRSTACS